MDYRSPWDVDLPAEGLKGRAILLGNKRAFSLSLPAANGPGAAQLHPHKWFGAYLYGRKFFEGQVVRAGNALLGGRCQTGMHVGLIAATRQYETAAGPARETYTVPDGITGFACRLEGPGGLTVEPLFDMRFALAPAESTDRYQVEPIDDGAVISNVLPAGEYDDATETFAPAPEGAEGVRLFAAVQVIGEWARVEMVPSLDRARTLTFQKDALRNRFIRHHAPEPSDHAPLWQRATGLVYAPLRLHLQGRGTVVYGFGATRAEALAQLAAVRDRLEELDAEKWAAAQRIVEHACLQTGNETVDTAYNQVLTRLMDALVARDALAPDTTLDRPATMILAGNGYFHDSWKRDENIALGALLTLGFYDLARQVVADTWQLQDPITGRLPQRIRAGEQPPYHSSDGTLWALWRLHQYWRATGDDPLLHEKLPMAALFFRRSLDRAVDGMLPSGRTQAPDYLWETWMDTPHTPRDGFPVEIQILWIACLRVFRPIMAATDEALERRMEEAEAAAWRALERFYVRDIPADSLDPALVARDLLTPNPYFCFGVGLDLGPQVEGAMRRHGRRQLAGRQGIVTLAPDDWGVVFPPEFLNDRRHVRGRRMRSAGKINYHRGLEWNWLAQFFVRAELKYADPDTAFRRYLRAQVDAALHRGGVGGISELFDLSGTRGPEFQAWSMAGLLEALHAFAGITVDVPGRRIGIEPQLPASWPELRVRRWYGALPFDVSYQVEDGVRRVQVEWPREIPAGAEIELALVLPRRGAAREAEVWIDGVPHCVPVQLEPIEGTNRVRARLTLPAAGQAEVRLVAARRAVARSA